MIVPATYQRGFVKVAVSGMCSGKVYLPPVICCFDGKVVSWTIGMRPDAQLVNTMLDAAIEAIDLSRN